MTDEKKQGEACNCCCNCDCLKDSSVAKPIADALRAIANAIETSAGK